MGRFTYSKAHSRWSVGDFVHVHIFLFVNDLSKKILMVQNFKTYENRDHLCNLGSLEKNCFKPNYFRLFRA